MTQFGMQSVIKKKKKRKKRKELLIIYYFYWKKTKMYVTNKLLYIYTAQTKKFKAYLKISWYVFAIPVLKHCKCKIWIITNNLCAYNSSIKTGELRLKKITLYVRCTYTVTAIIIQFSPVGIIRENSCVVKYK